MTGRIALSHGVTLNVRIDSPESSGPWLVLSNSLGATSAMWEPQMTILASRYRVLRYDTRGHGESDAPPGPYSFDDLLGDVIALLDRFEIDRTAFMGLSMGGMTGLGLAISHPNRLSRVVCADGRADAPEGFRAMWDERIAKVEAGGLAAIVDSTLASWLTENWRASHPEETLSIRNMILSNDSKGYAACCHALKELDYLRHLGRAVAPVLFVGGSEDKGAPPEVMREMAQATPGGVYREIPGAAHVANLNAPDEFNAAISDFLALS